MDKEIRQLHYHKGGYQAEYPSVQKTRVLPLYQLCDSMSIHANYFLNVVVVFCAKAAADRNHNNYNNKSKLEDLFFFFINNRYE